MASKSQIDSDLKAAMLSGERDKADVLRSLKAVILNEEVAQGKRDEGLDDATVEKLIAKEVKKRLDSVTQYTDAGRPELAEAEKAEAAILETYLPERLSEDDIKKVVDETIAAMGASGAQMMGPVMGAVKGKVGNTADGAVVARIVKEALTA